MAAVTKVAVEVILAPADFNKIGKAAAALNRGDPVVIDSAAAVDPRYHTTYKKAASETFVDGVVLKPCQAGKEVEIGTYCELDGYSGLTQGARLTVISGNIDTTAPAAGERGQFQALNATTIEFRK